MAIQIITDSTCDISPEKLNKLGVWMAPLKVIFNGKEYVDKKDLTTKEFYEKMKNEKKLPTTSQVNPDEFYKLFKRALDSGDKVIGIFISSELSGTYQSAVIAKEMLNSKDIFLIDSRMVSFGLGLLIFDLCDYIRRDEDIESILEKINLKIQNIKLYGVLDTLDNLKKGGRLSKTSAIIGGMLKLKPIINVKNGIVEAVHKSRGKNKGYKWIIDKMESEIGKNKIKRISIAHGNDLVALNNFKLKIMEKFEVEEIFEAEIGSVVGTHAGEGAIGVSYII